MSFQKLIASLCYIVCVLPTLNKTYLIWFERNRLDFNIGRNKIFELNIFHACIFERITKQ